MEFNLIPICNSENHKMEKSDYLVGNNIYCDICNNKISYFRCKNCEYVTCIDCQKEIFEEDNKIIKNMKNILCDEFTKIQKEVGDKYEVIYYKNTGNIYIYDPIKRSTKLYKNKNENRFLRCLNKIF